MKLTNDQKRDYYLEWLNDYLTVETFAEHKEWSIAYANNVISQGREIHQQNTLDNIIVESMIN